MCREVGGDNPHGKEDTHDEVDIHQRGGDTRDEKSDQARYVDETHRESRNRTRAWGDINMGDDAAEGKSARVLVRQRDTRGDIYARGQKTLVHREKRDRPENQGDPASHHAPEDQEDQEDQEDHYRQEG